MELAATLPALNENTYLDQENINYTEFDEQNLHNFGRLTKEEKQDMAMKYFPITFSYQRRFLNNLDNPSTVEDVLDLWPVFQSTKLYVLALSTVNESPDRKAFRIIGEE